MKNIYKKGVYALIAATLFASCKKEETLNANLDIMDQNVIEKTPLDVWLDNNYLNPYNIEVKYRFDRYELALGKVITPPLESQVTPTMEIVRDVWIKPYEAVGGPTFIKGISPKQFILAGSPEYNSNGTITLGTAEGGRKIVLYVVNDFDKTNLNSVKQMIQVIQHEYGHILNQIVDYPTDYQTISRGGYVANWTLETLPNGRALGFITQYARAAPGEDFAEMIANMLMMGPVTYGAILKNTPADGQAKLKKKEQYVVDYYKSAFNIDFYALQTEVQKALFNISAPALRSYIGPGVGYTTVTSTPDTDADQSAEFKALWNTAKAAITAQNYRLRDFSMTLKAGNIMTLRYNFSNAAGTTIYSGDADYSYTLTNGVFRFTLLATQPTTTTYGNMGVINASMTGVNNYFRNNQFRLDFFGNSTLQATGTKGVFYKTTDSNSYFYGTMGL